MVSAVLGGEDLGGRHQGGLPAVVPGRKHAGAGGNHRLARAHISLEQAVHRGTSGEIAADLPHRPELSFGQSKGEGAQEILDLHRLHGDRSRGVPGGAHRRESQRKGKELLENQVGAGQ